MIVSHKRPTVQHCFSQVSQDQPHYTLFGFQTMAGNRFRLIANNQSAGRTGHAQFKHPVSGWLLPSLPFCIGDVPHDLEKHIPLHLSFDTVHCFSNRLSVIPFLTLSDGNSRHSSDSIKKCTQGFGVHHQTIRDFGVHHQTIQYFGVRPLWKKT